MSNKCQFDILPVQLKVKAISVKTVVMRLKVSKK